MPRIALKSKKSSTRRLAKSASMGLTYPSERF